MHKHVDLIAILGGLIAGLAVAIITRLTALPEATVIGGSLVAASVIASAITKARVDRK